MPVEIQARNGRRQRHGLADKLATDDLLLDGAADGMSEIYAVMGVERQD
jgi:hypothetical protein